MTTLAHDARQPSLPDPLQRHLSAPAEAGPAVTTMESYIMTGGGLCTQAALDVLFVLLPAVRRKLLESGDQAHLSRRINLLMTYFTDMRTERRAPTPALRESAFALLYFLKGSDRIPDSIPEVGLVDDALIVEHVIERHESVLRTHWVQRGRRWPEPA